VPLGGREKLPLPLEIYTSVPSLCFEKWITYIANTGKLLTQVVAGGFYSMCVANAFKTMGGQCFYNMRRAMLSMVAEHIIGAAGEIGQAAFGRWPHFGNS
jgi:hypothetical protein